MGGAKQAKNILPTEPLSGQVLIPPVAEEKGEYAGKSDTSRSYTKRGALDGDYPLGFSFIPPEFNLPTHA